MADLNEIDSPDDPPLVKKLKELGLPVTRENFIGINWGDEPPDPWTIEAEMEVPKELQDWSWLESETQQ